MQSVNRSNFKTYLLTTKTAHVAVLLYVSTIVDILNILKLVEGYLCWRLSF